MSDARTDADTKPPLPEPVREDGIVDTHPEDQGSSDEVADGGLADLDTGKSDQRKII